MIRKPQSLRDRLEAANAADRHYAALYGVEPKAQSVIAPKREYTKTQAPEASEAQILKAIFTALHYSPQVAWIARMNSGAFHLTDGSGNDRFVRLNSQRGMSDLIGMLKGGRTFCIEVKSATGRIQPHQQAFLDLIADGGGLSGVARSVEDAQRIIGG
jgi:hypothetical protein